MTPRKIVVEIDEDAYEEIKQEIGVKFALDNQEGFCDEFILMFVKSLYAGLSTIHITKRKKGQRRTII
jgi:hypothetical protein